MKILTFIPILAGWKLFGGQNLVTQKIYLTMFEGHLGYQILIKQDWKAFQSVWKRKKWQCFLLLQIIIRHDFWQILTVIGNHFWPIKTGWKIICKFCDTRPLTLLVYFWPIKKKWLILTSFNQFWQLWSKFDKFGLTLISLIQFWQDL